MTKFKINEQAEVVCEYKRTRNGFKHTATLLINGRECESTKCNYLNRTWEAYEFQSVLEKLADKITSLSADDVIKFRDQIRNEFREKDLQEVNKTFHTIGAIAQLGEIFCKTPKAQNDWKARMIKAGLEAQGLTMPDDWDNLSEEAKKARLDAVISELTSK